MRVTGLTEREYEGDFRCRSMQIKVTSTSKTSVTKFAMSVADGKESGCSLFIPKIVDLNAVSHAS